MDPIVSPGPTHVRHLATLMLWQTAETCSPGCSALAILKQKSKAMPSCPRTGCHKNSYDEPLLQLEEGLAGEVGPASWVNVENGGNTAGCDGDAAVAATTAQYSGKPRSMTVSLILISQLTADVREDGGVLCSKNTSGAGACTEIVKQRGQPLNGSELLDALTHTTNTSPANDGNGAKRSTRCIEAKYGKLLLMASTAERVAELGRPLPSTRSMSRRSAALRSATASVALNACPTATDTVDCDGCEVAAQAVIEGNWC